MGNDYNKTIQFRFGKENCIEIKETEAVKNDTNEIYDFVESNRRLTFKEIISLIVIDRRFLPVLKYFFTKSNQP